MPAPADFLSVIGREMLDLPGLDVTDERLARFLGVDRTLVSHWRSGARTMPVDVVVHLARLSRDPCRVLGYLAAHVGCRVVPDLAAAPTDRELLMETVDVSVSAGALLSEVHAAAADGVITDDELARIEAAEAHARRQLDHVRAGCAALRKAPGVRAVGVRS